MLVERGADGAPHAALGNGFTATAASLRKHGAEEDLDLARKISAGR